jgi:hypothetical protein
MRNPEQQWPDEADGPDDTTPVTPHATPSIDAEGTLSYVGDDGRRYVVAPPPTQQPPAQP